MIIDLLCNNLISMRLIGRKHGFRIGSGRTVKAGLKLHNLNVETYKEIAGTNNDLLDKAQK